MTDIPICPTCKKPMTPPRPEDAKDYRATFGPGTFYECRGCGTCSLQTEGTRKVI